MEQALARLKEAIKHLRDIGKSHNQQDMADRLSMGKGNFSRAINGAPRYFTKGFLVRFAEAYSDYINKEWLVDGVGPMEKADMRTTRPHIPMQVAAGQTGVATDTVVEAEIKHNPIIAGLPDYDFTIGVKGDSMEPVLFEGDILACHRLENIREIKPDTIYVIETTEGAVAKQIAHAAKSELTLHSLNLKYSDYDVPSDTVRSISQIMGLIRPNPTFLL